MTIVQLASLVLFGACFAGIALVFVAYPLLLMLQAMVARPSQCPGSTIQPSVSLIVVARNAEELIDAKVRNCLELDYPRNRLELILCSDGSTDRTMDIMRSRQGPHVRCLASDEHKGKTQMLNRAATLATGNLLVFSDVDANLPTDALVKLTAHFADPKIGGACGQRRIWVKETAMGSAQQIYIGLDSMIKMLETRVGSISSNDGKLYAIRRELFEPIPPGVTDDFYTSLAVVRQGYRFIFEPRALAYVPAPARGPRHEVDRRRRVVSRSLRGIWLMRGLLVPFKNQGFAVRLAINKVCRRLMPFWFVGLLISSALLIPSWPVFLVPAGAQIAILGASLLYPVVRRVAGRGRALTLLSVPFYFTLGNFGILLGVIDFLRGTQIVKWDPRKEF